MRETMVAKAPSPGDTAPAHSGFNPTPALHDIEHSCSV